MRGNLAASAGSPRYGGSIPAYAGEPLSGNSSGCAGTVYPRVCGGTPGRSRQAERGAGLSPRMRGNPPRVSLKTRPKGSIPAYAGEPRVAVGSGGAGRVYPRVCGGTPSMART